MKTPRIYHSILAVFCIAVLCTGMACAADQTSSPRHNSTFAKGSGHQGFDLTNTTLQQETIVRFQQQGIDVTGLQAAFQSGNMTDVKEWMNEHRPAFNATGSRHMSEGKTRMESGRPGFDLTNTTLQQEAIARFQEQGIDVTGLQTAFQSGNMTDVMGWMMEHGPAFNTTGSRLAPEFKTGMGSAGHQGFDLTNTTLQQEMLTRLQEQGVDVTGLQTAFQSGNMTEVREWMQEHHPTPAARTGTGSEGTA